MSWPAVRVAVLEGLSKLVDNPHAQPMMKEDTAPPRLAALGPQPQGQGQGSVFGHLMKGRISFAVSSLCQCST